MSNTKTNMKEYTTTIKYRGLNEPQTHTIKKIKKLAKSSRWIDLQFRDNGEFKNEQADFLREILQQIYPEIN